MLDETAVVRFGSGPSQQRLLPHSERTVGTKSEHRCGRDSGRDVNPDETWVAQRDRAADNQDDDQREMRQRNRSSKGAPRRCHASTVPAYVALMTGVRALNISAKVLLFALLLHAVLYPDLPQYVDKGMPYRLALYPVAALLVPAIELIRGANRHRPYPHLIDLCVVLPFLLDTAGNTANLYDTVTWWDDLMHVLTWIPLVIAFGLVVRERAPGRLNVAALTVGFGAVTHILWEIAEYTTFVEDNPQEAKSAYRDTIGDLAASLIGSLIGAAIVATWLWITNRQVRPPLES
jgi:hypothetical protein